MTGAGGWTLVHCDDEAIVTAARVDGQCLLRFVQFNPLTTWTSAVAATAAGGFVADVAAAWRPTETIIGPAPAPPTEGGSP